jgi:phosphoglycerate dehydrogenase-like enzyme
MVEDSINVLVAMDFSDAIMDRLKAISPRLKFTRKVVKSASDIPEEVWANTDILYTGSLLPEVENVPRLQWVQVHSAGVDNLLPNPLFTDTSVLLTTTSGIHATTMAEFAFSMILALARKIPTMLRYQQKSEWPADRHNLYLPRELRGSTLGILGYGAIGREIARVAQVFGMHILATKRNVMTPATTNHYAEGGTGDPDAALVERLYPPEATKSMVSLCDFVVVLIPLTATTRQFVNADILSGMKKSAYLINLARGAVIDEEALIKALSTNQIAGAALDVFVQEPLPSSSPLWKLDNVIVSPHLAGNSSRYHENAAEVFAQNLERWLSKKELLNRVDTRQGY